jgi:hypothetical protein
VADPVAVVTRALVYSMVAALIASCGAANVGTATSRAEPIRVAETAPTFPRTAAYYLDQDELPSIDELARYDVVVIDNEWAHRMPRSFFDRLHARNPRLKLLAYVNVVDSVHEIGSYEYWRNAYAMWRITPEDRAFRFPDQWLAKTASGAPVHEWEDRVMANLTDRAPRVDGRLFVEYAADWIADTVWTAGIWDGVFLDVWGDRIWTADADRWDVDRDGVDETDAEIYAPGGPWDRGLTIGERRLRSALPTAILVANGNRTLRDGLLNGRVFESFADPAVRPDPIDDVYSYVDTASSGGQRRPSVSINVNTGREPPGSPAALRKARFRFVATLLQDGYWAPMGKDYGVLEYYDEMDGAGRGAGYLGRPLQPDPTVDALTRPREAGTGSPLGGVLRRDFENGIVLLNTTPGPVSIELERPYSRLQGTQDPVTNDGARASSVTIDGHDGIVLVR